jgi:biopolymer transport protein TolR
MAFQVGNPDGQDRTVAPVMNVTPLVDVVLVLLIIFMVITPLLSKKFWIHTPKQEKKEVEKTELAKDPDPPLELTDRLRRMFAARDDHVLFFDAANEVPYGLAVQVLDKAREGGAVTIATLTAALEAAAGPSQP